jgi:hypothetical protein
MHVWHVLTSSAGDSIVSVMVSFSWLTHKNAYVYICATCFLHEASHCGALSNLLSLYLSRSNTLLSTPFSNTFDLCSSLNVRDQVSYPFKQIPRPESASELYRPSDSRLSSKLASTFADKEVSRSQHGGSPTTVILVFWTGAATFLIAPKLYSRGWVNPRYRPSTSQKIW